MIWSPSRNFCFVHVPKTGGTAIEQAYKPHLRFGDVVLAAWRLSLDNWYEEHLGLGKHAHASVIAQHLGIERFRRVISFAVLRDPLERMVSYYRWISSYDHKGETEKALRVHDSFESFVEAGCKHLAPQADHVCDPATGMPIISVLAPYPHLAEAWREIGPRIGIEAPLPIANASQPLPVDITTRAREIVARHYARDAELFQDAMAGWPARRGATAAPPPAPETPQEPSGPIVVNEGAERLGEAAERMEARLAALEIGMAQRFARVEAAVKQAGRRSGYYLGDHKALSVMENGQMLLVDTRSRDIAMRVLATGRWEENETTAFARLIRPGDTVFDVGANHGVFALLAGPRCRPGGQVHAFEPNPDLAQLVTMSSWINGLQQVVTVHPLAASDTEGEAVLTASEAYSGGGSLRQRRAATGFAGSEFRAISCRTVRLDDMFPDPAFCINVMKIDVEGFEGRVLRGMPNLLKRSTGLKMVMEFAPQMMKDAGVPAAEVTAILRDLGFSAWVISPGAALRPVGWDVLAKKAQGIVNLVVAREKPY